MYAVAASDWRLPNSCTCPLVVGKHASLTFNSGTRGSYSCAMHDYLFDARLCHLELLRRRVDLIVQLLRVDLRLFKLRCLEVERRLQLRRLLRALVGRAATAREPRGERGMECVGMSGDVAFLGLEGGAGSASWACALQLTSLPARRA